MRRAKQHKAAIVEGGAGYKIPITALVLLSARAGVSAASHWERQEVCEAHGGRVFPAEDG